MLQKLPNILTISRIVLLPVLIGLFFVPGATAAWTALWIYTFCAVTDFLDGWIARKFGSTSGFGTFLDPISTKSWWARCSSPSPRSTACMTDGSSRPSSS